MKKPPRNIKNQWGSLAYFTNMRYHSTNANMNEVHIWFICNYISHVRGKSHNIPKAQRRNRKVTSVRRKSDCDIMITMIYWGRTNSMAQPVNLYYSVLNCSNTSSQNWPKHCAQWWFWRVQVNPIGISCWCPAPCWQIETLLVRPQMFCHANRIKRLKYVLTFAIPQQRAIQKSLEIRSCSL